MSRGLAWYGFEGVWGNAQRGVVTEPGYKMEGMAAAARSQARGRQFLPDGDMFPGHVSFRDSCSCLAVKRWACGSVLSKGGGVE